MGVGYHFREKATPANTNLAGTAFVFLLVNFTHALRKLRATIPRGKVKLVIIANTVPVAHRSKPGTHGCKAWVGLFHESRIILKMCALLAGRPGITQLD